MIEVVAAYQSPALFNILATSKQWRLRMAPLGDHEELAELAELDVPTWTEADPSPELVVVCSPAQCDAAKQQWPDAKRIWAVHNGFERWLLPAEYEQEVVAAVCFSDRVRWLQQTGRTTRFVFLSPAYEAMPTWTWEPNHLWTLRNRIAERKSDGETVIAAVTEGLAHVYYGQGQPAGIADRTKKVELRSSCSGYISALHRSAGFGLAEHEAMAAGVPVIGGWWGDLDKEIGPGYWGLVDDIRDMKRAARKVADSSGDATRLSQMGLEYIRRYRTADRMDDSITSLLSAIG